MNVRSDMNVRGDMNLRSDMNTQRSEVEPGQTTLAGAVNPQLPSRNFQIQDEATVYESPVFEPHISGGTAYSTFKLTFDLAGSLAILAVTAPLFPIIAGVVKITSKGPIIFRQQRLTKDGREFTIYKFRTMKVNAEAGSGAVWAEKDDPRVTRVGSFLRITRLDELPQLINVLKGDMSLIGPRPERPEFAELIADEVPGFHRRLRVKAGLTGLAQVRSGYSACMDGHRKKLAWDLLYIRRRSVMLDCWIAIKTVTVMLSRSGAR